MRKYKFLLSALMPAWASMAQRAMAQPEQRQAYSADLTRAAVLQVMAAAADWQLKHPSQHPPYDWTVAAFYTGMMAFAEVTDSPKYYEAMTAMGERNQWRPGLRPAHADDHAVIATYAKIYQREKDKRPTAARRLVTEPENGAALSRSATDAHLVPGQTLADQAGCHSTHDGLGARGNGCVPKGHQVGGPARPRCEEDPTE